MCSSNQQLPIRTVIDRLNQSRDLDRMHWERYVTVFQRRCTCACWNALYLVTLVFVDAARSDEQRGMPHPAMHASCLCGPDAVRAPCVDDREVRAFISKIRC
jgi:hypothetical protein